MKKPYSNISDTNSAFGNKFGIVFEKGVIVDYDKIYNQAMNLYDELEELHDDGFSILIDSPHSKEGRKGMVDAIADLLVFLYGIPHFLGYRYTEKTANSVLQDVLISYKNNGYDTFYSHVVEDIKQLIDEIIKSISKKQNHSLIMKNVEELDVYLMTLCNLYNVDVDSLIQKVTDSNFSKLCKDEIETDATLKFYRDKGVEVYSAESPIKQEDGSPFFVVYSSKEQTVQNKVYRAHKFLKCINWFEPDISDI
jgi:predicted HAD superfamily Cof-like phosphohydrolase